MNNIIMLKDSEWDDPYSKLNNFIYEWIKWYPVIKIPSTEYNIKNDVVILNINKRINQLENYNVDGSNKKIGIVYSINEINLTYMNTCDYLIFLNPLLKQIADCFGVKKPSFVCPCFPLNDYSNISYRKIDYAYFGGMLYDSVVDGLSDFLIYCDKKIPKNIIFFIAFSYGHYIDKKEKIANIISDLSKNRKILNRIFYVQDVQQSFDIMKYNTMVSKYGCLYSSQPTIEEINDLLNSKNDLLLSYDISESSMLSEFRSTKTNIICGDHANYISFLKNSESYFTYKMFADSFSNIIKNM